MIIHGKFRNQIAAKIGPSNGFGNGSKGINLTNEEYQQIIKMCWFPKLPPQASNIQYNYGYDGFLPDYIFTLEYDLPVQMKVDTIDLQQGDFSRYRSFKIVGDKKRVTYIESER